MGNLHATLDLTDRRNIYFVGDLHGDWELFNFALKQLKFNYRDHIISVGDLIDRGEGHLECLMFFLNTENATAVRGNHEDMMIAGLLHHDRQQHMGWVQNGGMWHLEYPDLMIEGIARVVEKEFPIAVTVNYENVKVGVCHAECPTTRWQDFTLMIEGNSKAHIRKALWAREKIREKVGTPILGVDHTIHGHSVRNQPVKKCNQHWIDTGSVFSTGGWGDNQKNALTIAELVDGEIEYHRFVKDNDEPGGFRWE